MFTGRLESEEERDIRRERDIKQTGRTAVVLEEPQPGGVVIVRGNEVAGQKPRGSTHELQEQVLLVEPFHRAERPFERRLKFPFSPLVSAKHPVVAGQAFEAARMFSQEISLDSVHRGLTAASSRASQAWRFRPGS